MNGKARKATAKGLGGCRAAAMLAAMCWALPATGADPDRGEELYLAHGCYACHGYDGTGRTPLADGVSGVTVDPTAFVTFLRLRADENPTLPSNGMPSYAATTLPDEDALDIRAYILTLEDDPPAIDDIPAFRAILDSAERGQKRDRQ